MMPVAYNVLGISWELLTRLHAVHPLRFSSSRSLRSANHVYLRSERLKITPLNDAVRVFQNWDEKSDW